MAEPHVGVEPEVTERRGKRARATDGDVRRRPSKQNREIPPIFVRGIVIDSVVIGGDGVAATARLSTTSRERNFEECKLTGQGS